MTMTVVLFQIDFDRFSAIAVDLDHQSHVWESRFDGTWFERGAAILRVTVDSKAIEDAGFALTKPAKPN
jgi:hypothetical protein